jgi:D-alanine-D-alanine ligase-like ATP-grasp enzyme
VKRDRQETAIAIIHGGTSSESGISTSNAQFVEAALRHLGYPAENVHYDGAMIDRLRSLAPRGVFLCVQGKGHGDGTLQATLDFLGLPYTGSRTLGAAIINDKIVCKELFQYAGVRTPAWQVLSRADYKIVKQKDFTARH